MSVEMSFYDSEMISLTTVVANGVGNSAQKKGFLSGRSKEDYAVSVEMPSAVSAMTWRRRYLATTISVIRGMSPSKAGIGIFMWLAQETEK